jgi:hypothetical protein
MFLASLRTADSALSNKSKHPLFHRDSSIISEEIRIKLLCKLLKNNLEWNSIWADEEILRQLNQVEISTC